MLVKEDLAYLWNQFVDQEKELFEGEQYLWYDPTDNIYKKGAPNSELVATGSDRSGYLYYRVRFMLLTSSIKSRGEVKLWTDGSNAVEWEPAYLNESLVQKEEG